MTDSDPSHEQVLPLSGPGAPVPEPPQVDGYEILGWLGGGGMGAVWQAKQLSTDREVALKVMNQKAISSGGKAQSRFHREVRIAAHLEHRNIARVYESGIHRDHDFYAMELIDGKPLDTYVRTQGLSVQAILELMHRVCSAVEYAHRRDIIHRDLKHSNIMVTPDGQPHVLDFGLARDLLARDRDRMVSLDGEVIGTPEFMSPEQAAGDIDAVGTRSDVYSLGVILYNLLTERWPYELSGKPYEDLKTIQEQEPTRPSAVVTGFDRDLEAILLKALAKFPSERYRSAEELGDDIQQWLAGRPVSARSIDTWYLAKKFIRRNRVAVSVVSLVIVVILSTGFIGLYSYGQARSASHELESRVAAFRQYVRENTALLNQMAVGSFLQFWEVADGRAQGSLRFLPKESRESEAVRFLLDPRSLEEKRSQFNLLFSGENRAFGQFIVGEWFLHESQPARAADAYRMCLADAYDSNDPIEWFRSAASERLAQLSTASQGVQRR